MCVKLLLTHCNNKRQLFKHWQKWNPQREMRVCNGSVANVAKSEHATKPNDKVKPIVSGEACCMTGHICHWLHHCFSVTNANTNHIPVKAWTQNCDSHHVYAISQCIEEKNLHCGAGVWCRYDIFYLNRVASRPWPYQFPLCGRFPPSLTERLERRFSICWCGWCRPQIAFCLSRWQYCGLGRRQRPFDRLVMELVIVNRIYWEKAHVGKSSFDHQQKQNGEYNPEECRHK